MSMVYYELNGCQWQQLTIFEGELFCRIFVQHKRENLLFQIFFTVTTIFTAVNEDVKFPEKQQKVGTFEEHENIFMHD